MDPNIERALRRLLDDIMDNHDAVMGRGVGKGKNREGAVRKTTDSVNRSLNDVGDAVRPFLVAGVTELDMAVRMFDAMRMEGRKIASINLGGGVTIVLEDGVWYATLDVDGEEVGRAELIDPQRWAGGGQPR